MNQTRNWINLQLQAAEYHPQLCCNFDQVWSLMYAPKKRTLQLRESGTVDDLSRSRSMRAIRHILERALDVPYTESMVKDDNPCPPKPKVQGGASATGSVEMWRVPRTLTTLSWRDGTLGRGFITCRDDTLTSAQRDLANQARGIFRWVFFKYISRAMFFDICIYIYMHTYIGYIYIYL